jgi:SAM-dependent methyltransferase
MLELDGERAIPDLMNSNRFTRQLLWEHLERYRFAQGYARDKRVLDIACGSGFGTKMLRDVSGEAVVGVDISNQALDYARARYHADGIVWEHANAESYTGYGKFDVVVSFETIEHLKSPATFVAKVHTDLREGGVFLASTPIVKFSGYDDFHLHVLKEDELRAMFTGAGFRIEEELITSFWCSPLHALHSRVTQSRASLSHWDVPFLEVFKNSFTGLFWESLTLVGRKTSDTTAARPTRGIPGKARRVFSCMLKGTSTFHGKPS